MFTGRQAIRWAEVWLSCWNDGDFDTLLALHRSDAQLAPADRAVDPGLGRREALRRHWGALPLGLHSVPAELDEVAWNPQTRELVIAYVSNLHGTRVRGRDLVRLDAAGRVISGEACAGSIVDEPVEREQAYERDWIFTEATGGRQ